MRTSLHFPLIGNHHYLSHKKPNGEISTPRALQPPRFLEAPGARDGDLPFLDPTTKYPEKAVVGCIVSILIYLAWGNPGWYEAEENDENDETILSKSRKTNWSAARQPMAPMAPLADR